MIRFGAIAVVIYVLGIFSHIGYAAIQDVIHKADACERTACAEVAEITYKLEKVKPPAMPVQPKKGN